MIPIADESPRGYVPFINYLLLAANIAVFFFWQENTEAFFAGFGLTPSRISESPLNIPGYKTFFTSMFLHGDILHLAGNMLYLWIFGDNIEYLVGHGRYLFFYLVVGLSAALVQFLFNPLSTVPMIGASGAISGVLGAYLLKYPRNKISILFFFIIIIRVVKIPAVIVLTFWFILQLYNGYGQLLPGSEGGVAWFAHIGGFVAGFLLIKQFERSRKKRT